jgi:DNA-binding CsgD family transcriptional regulator
MSFDLPHQHRSAGRVLQITPLERQALQLLAHGKSASELSSALGLGVHEIGVLLTRLFAALGTATRVEAVALARKRGLLAPDALSG